MIKKTLKIKNIPAILWGDHSEQLFIAIHGNMSNKADDAIVILAEEVVPMGYQVLSFDLPEHGERKNESIDCKVQNCVPELKTVINYAQSIAHNISIFACSMGAYFSLLAYFDLPIKQCLFLSPVINMERIINNMMTWFGISEARLKTEKEIETPIGQVLDWDYYCYVKSHPVREWDKLTSILYGSKDELSEFAVVSSFAEQYNCNLVIMADGEHYFHTDVQLEFFRQWLKDHLIPIPSSNIQTEKFRKLV